MFLVNPAPIGCAAKSVGHGYPFILILAHRPNVLGTHKLDSYLKVERSDFIRMRDMLQPALFSSYL